MAFSIKDALGATVVRKTTVDGNGQHVHHVIVDSQPVPTNLLHGQVNTSSSNPQQFPANAVSAKIEVRALPTNVGVVYVGASGVSASDGFPLSATSKPFQVVISNTSALYVFAASAGDGVAFIGG